jgi:hypothetical protein
MHKRALVLVALSLAAAACGDDGSGSGGSGGGSSSAAGSSTTSSTTTSSSSTSSSGGGGAGGDDGSSGAGGDTGSSSSGTGGDPGTTCGDCSDDERCQECLSDNEDEDPYFECWPREAPEGEFVCGSTTCFEFGQYCEEDVLLVTSCSDYRCKDVNPECESDDPCDCVVNPCPGIEEVECTVSGGQVFVTCGLF